MCTNAVVLQAFRTLRITTHHIPAPQDDSPALTYKWRGHSTGMYRERGHTCIVLGGVRKPQVIPDVSIIAPLARLYHSLHNAAHTHV